MNTFQHLKRDLIDGAEFDLTRDSLTSRVLIEAIRSFQMARDALRGELLGKDPAFDIGWRYLSPYKQSWNSAISARVDSGIMIVKFQLLDEGEYGQEICSVDDQEFFVFEILAFFDGGNCWKKRVRDDLVAEVNKEVLRLSTDLELKLAALIRIREVNVSA